MRDNWFISWRNLARNKRRHVLTGLAIAFGSIGLVLLGAYLIRIEAYMRVTSVYLNHKGHVSIYKHQGLTLHQADPKRYTLTASDQALIASAVAKDPRIEFTGRYLDGVALLANGCQTKPVLVSGSEVEVEQRIHRHPTVLERSPELVQVEGKGFWTVVGNSMPVSITPTLAHLIGKPKLWQPGEANSTVVPDCEAPGSSERIAADANVQLLGQTYRKDFAGIDAQIVSHHSTGLELLEDTSLQAPLPMLQSLFETDAVTYVALFLNSEKDAHAVAASMRETLAAAGLDADVYTYDDPAVNVFYVGSLNFVIVMVIFFAFLIWGVSSLSIVNSLTMTIIERSQEIGMMRAMGFMPHQIALTLTGESLFLTIISLALGGLLGSLAALSINALNIRFAIVGQAGTMQFLLEPTLSLCAVVTLSTVTITTLCAYIVCRLQLRGEIATLVHGHSG